METGGRSNSFEGTHGVHSLTKRNGNRLYARKEGFPDFPVHSLTKRNGNCTRFRWKTAKHHLVHSLTKRNGNSIAVRMFKPTINAFAA